MHARRVARPYTQACLRTHVARCSRDSGDPVGNLGFRVDEFLGVRSVIRVQYCWWPLALDVLSSFMFGFRSSFSRSFMVSHHGTR